MVYSDVVNNGLILEYKNKYNIRDFKKLVNAGYTQLQARFIIICSKIYHHGIENNDALPLYFYSEKFTLKCKYNLIKTN